MQNTLHSHLLVAALCSTALSHLVAQTSPRTVTILTTFDYPKSLATTGVGINDAGDVVGTFGVRHYTYGFERFADGTVQSIIDNEAGNVYSTFLYGINNAGLICGEAHADGFFYSGGVITFDYMANFIEGVNNAGDFAGSSGLDGCASIGGNFILFDVPGAVVTEAKGINNRDEIVGRYQDAARNTYGFYRDPAGNLTYPISINNSIYTVLHGINDSGEIVGEWADPAIGEYSHGLVMRLPNHIISFDVPGAYNTSANGINSSGAISGGFYNAKGSGIHAFIGQLGK